MKTKSKELNVDFIGEQGVKLTKKEEESISMFIKQQQLKKQKLTIRKNNRVTE